MPHPLLTMPKSMELRSMQSHELWLLIAEQDFKASLVLQKAVLHAQAVYFAQQAAEKALKGYLEFSRGQIKKTHDLETLVFACANYDIKFETLVPCAYFLSPYATELRYPQSYKVLMNYETSELIKHAKKILYFVTMRAMSIHPK